MRHPIRELVRRAEEQGWRVENTSKSHLRWYAPTGRIIVSSSTPSDDRGLRNHIAMMKREGFKP